MNQPVLNGAYIAPTATVVGDVTLAPDVNIWYGAVLRGDAGAIAVGEGTNIQDLCVLHEGAVVGKYCTVGHGAIVHGCTVGDHSMIGMGAIVLTGAKIGSHCVIGAGAVVKENMEIPDGHIAVGIPAKIVGETKQSLIDDIYEDERIYLRLSAETFG